jgi:hypothetical protein
MARRLAMQHFVARTVSDPGIDQEHSDARRADRGIQAALIGENLVVFPTWIADSRRRRTDEPASNAGLLGNSEDGLTRK